MTDPRIERTTYQKGWLTGWTDPEHYLEGAVVKLTYKHFSKADERSILIERRGDSFVLLPFKNPWWHGDKSCKFIITNEKNIFVAMSSAEAVLFDTTPWFSTEPLVV